MDVPSYFNLDAVLAYRWNRVELFLKVTNIFDNFIYTELGFPWRSRYFELGIRADLLNLLKPDAKLLTNGIRKG